jgi:Zn-dependent protease
MALAFFSCCAIRLIKVFPEFESGFGGSVAFLLFHMMIVNVSLSIINMIPIPPLDGSKVITYFLPVKLKAKYLSLNPYIGLIMLYVVLSSGMVRSVRYSIINFFGTIFCGMAF